MMAPRDHGEAHGVDLLQQYISRVDEIIGERTSTEQKYDHEVVRWMRRGKSIRKAIAKANEKYPREALRVNNDNLADVEALQILGRTRNCHGEIGHPQVIDYPKTVSNPFRKSAKAKLHPSSRRGPKES